MKKLVSILLAVLLCASCFALAVVPASAGEGGNCGQNVGWTMGNDGVVVISGTGPMTEYYSAADSPFYSRRFDIKEVVIEEGVTSVGKRAFCNCTNLESLTLSDSVTRIGEQAFWYCSKLDDLQMGENCGYVGQYAFSNCTGLKGVSFWTGTAIEYGAFRSCTAIENVWFFGTPEEWNLLEIGPENDCLKARTPHYEVIVTQIAGPGGFVGYEGTKTSVNSYSERGEIQVIWATPAEGYRFIGWYDENGDLYSENAEAEIFPMRSMTLTAKFEKIEAESHCAWCGGHHENAGLIEMLIGWFHGILAMLFGARY